MIFAGLTGGMACGKSFAGQEFSRLGAYLIEADQLGHQVLLPGGEAYEETVREFGPGILAADGTIDRSALAALVFPAPAALERLNAIVHPAVRSRAAALAKASTAAVVIYAAAVLIESGGYKDCDKIIVVTCSQEQQFERALERGGVPAEQIRARLARQLPLNEKLHFADYLIDTSGTKSETLRQTKMVYNELVELSKL